MLLSRNKGRKQLGKWRKVLIAIFALFIIITAFAIAYGKWCEIETRPLLDRLEQISNHEIEVDPSDGKEYRFSLNLTANNDEAFSESSIEPHFISLIGNSGKIKLDWINRYKESSSEKDHIVITQVVLYIERIDDKWVIKDMMALA